MKTTPGILLILVCLFLGMARSAYAGEPPELTSSRADYVRDLQAATLPVLQRYIQTLTALRGQFVREQRLEAAAAVDKEIKLIQHESAAADKTADLSKNDPADPTIVSATYGWIGHGDKTVDVTDKVRKAFGDDEQGTLNITMGLNDGNDPAKSHGKQLQIDYIINGQKKQKVFSEHTRVSVKDLN